LALFLLPRRREDGSLNYRIRRLKDKTGTRSVPTGEVVLTESEAWLLGSEKTGVYQILEVLNLSRVANSIAGTALAQRALAEAETFARQRVAFGRPIIEQPLMRRQFNERKDALREAFALAWEAARLLDEVWREVSPYSERYHLFRLVAHLAKYHTAEFAAQTAKWAMEVHGGMGVLAEYGVERWFREAMVLAIWEGTSHRQILDGLEVMQRQGAHRLLLQDLEALADPASHREMTERLEEYLLRPAGEQEARAEGLFRDLAGFSAAALGRKYGE
jgi:alkylation response protein AidB-like acyl-CoA dehydrogenase